MKVAVVVPCYKVGRAVLLVLADVPALVDHIICVDDGCPDNSADLIEQNQSDPRVEIIRHKSNLGVGAAMVSGYQRALTLDADIIVKIDGDGQMSPKAISQLIAPILNGDADYTKGNRFFFLSGLNAMPTSRLLGNAALSFMSKLSAGYWRIFDPTNGFTAIHRYFNYCRYNSSTLDTFLNRICCINFRLFEPLYRTFPNKLTMAMKIVA